MGAAFSNDDDYNTLNIKDNKLNIIDNTLNIKDNNSIKINNKDDNNSGYYFGNPLLSINSKRLLPDDVKQMLTYKKYLKYKEKYEN